VTIKGGGCHECDALRVMPLYGIRTLLDWGRACALQYSQVVADFFLSVCLLIRFPSCPPHEARIIGRCYTPSL